MRSTAHLRTRAVTLGSEPNSERNIAVIETSSAPSSGIEPTAIHWCSPGAETSYRLNYAIRRVHAKVETSPTNRIRKELTFGDSAKLAVHPHTIANWQRHPRRMGLSWARIVEEWPDRTPSPTLWSIRRIG